MTSFVLRVAFCAYILRLHSLTATRLEPKNPRYHMELARAYVNQEIPLDTDETKEMLAIRALRAAIDYAPLASDTRIVAFYRMHFTWRMLARSAEDGDPAKLEIYRLALQAIKASLRAVKGVLTQRSPFVSNHRHAETNIIFESSHPRMSVHRVLARFSLLPPSFARASGRFAKSTRTTV